MENKVKKVWQILGVAVLCAVCVLGAVLGVLFGMNHSSEDLSVSKDMSNQDNLVVETVQEQGIRLMSGVATTAAANGTVSKTLTAEITPSTVSNKKVNWSVAWSSDAALKDKPISDYITVTPTADGALTATVTCKKSFRGSVAVVTVTSRDSGVKGICLVKFAGVPSSLTVNVSGIATQSRGSLTGVLALKMGQTYTQAISLSNAFNDVGSEYGTYSVTVTGVGSFKKGSYYANQSGTWWDNEETVTLESVKNDYIAVSISNGKLVINAKGRYESMAGTVNGGSGGGVVHDKYKEDVKDSSGNLPYYKIVVKDSVSGLSKTINVYIVASVTSVSLSSSEITF